MSLDELGARAGLGPGVEGYQWARYEWAAPAPDEDRGGWVLTGNGLAFVVFFEGWGGPDGALDYFTVDGIGAVTDSDAALALACMAVSK